MMDSLYCVLFVSLFVTLTRVYSNLDELKPPKPFCPLPIKEIVHIESLEKITFSLEIFKVSGFLASSSIVLRNCFLVLLSIESHDVRVVAVAIKAIISANNAFFIFADLTVLSRAWLIIVGIRSYLVLLIGVFGAANHLEDAMLKIVG